MPKKPKTESKPTIDEEKLAELLHEELSKEPLSYNNRERVVKRLIPRITSLVEV